jgi:hypothetical protein
MSTRRWPLVFAILLAGAISACAAAATPAQTVVQAQVVAPTSAPAATSVASNVVGGSQPGLLPPAQQMIIKNADIELLVSDTGQALAHVTQLARDDGGYILSTQTSYEGDLEHASLQLAVPAAQFETVLNQLRGLGIKVLRESTTGQDVSAEYTDLQSRLNNLEATAARVRTFLDASKTVEDSLRVNGQLSDLEGQIEQIKGQMKYYEGRAAFSTMTVTLTPQAPVELPQSDPAWNPLRTLSRAGAALSQLLRFGTDMAIWFLVLTSPLTIALAGLLVVRYRVGVRRRTAPRS